MDIVEQYKVVQDGDQSIQACRELLSSTEKRIPDTIAEIYEQERRTDLFELEASSVDTVSERKRESTWIYVSPGVSQGKPCVRFVSPEQLADLRKLHGSENIIVSEQTGPKFQLCRKKP